MKQEIKDTTPRGRFKKPKKKTYLLHYNLERIVTKSLTMTRKYPSKKAAKEAQIALEKNTSILKASNFNIEEK